MQSEVPVLASAYDLHDLKKDIGSLHDSAGLIAEEASVEVLIEPVLNEFSGLRWHRRTENGQIVLSRSNWATYTWRGALDARSKAGK